MKSSGAYRQERTNLSSLEFDDDRDYGILPVAYYKNSSYRVFFEAERKRLEKDYNGGELKLYLYEAYKSRNTMEAKKAGPEPMAREKALAIYRQFAKNNTGLELTDEAVEHAYASLFETNEVVGAMITDDEAYMSEYLENIINEHIEEMERNLEMKISEFTKIDQPALFKANASVVPYEGKNYYIYTGYSY